MASSTTVRPITLSQQLRAFGHPWQKPISIFLSLQGVLLYLKRYQIKPGQQWFKSKYHFLQFSAMIGGGYFLGWCIALAGFRDKQLYRLAIQHQYDVAYSVGYDTKSSEFADIIPTKSKPDMNFLKDPNEMVSVEEFSKKD